jgi:hypothetical protein
MHPTAMFFALFAHSAVGFQVIVDLNLFSQSELAQVNKLPVGLDGAWEISVNSANTTDAEWKTALSTVAPQRFVVTEDNPMGFSECQRYARIAGSPPSLAFGYHETGGQPHTQLNSSEIDLYHEKCRAQVVILTRAYWPGSDWKTGVTKVLNNSNLAGVAMEFNPGDFGKRNEDDFVRDMLAAEKMPFFLFSPGADGHSQEDDVKDAITSYIKAGIPMHNDNVHVVIARYGSATPQPCPSTNPGCVYGATNSVAAALREALKLKAQVKQAEIGQQQA